LGGGGGGGGEGGRSNSAGLTGAEKESVLRGALDCSATVDFSGSVRLGECAAGTVAGAGLSVTTSTGSCITQGLITTVLYARQVNAADLVFRHINVPIVLLVLLIVVVVTDVVVFRAGGRCDRQLYLIWLAVSDSRFVPTLFPPTSYFDTSKSPPSSSPSSSSSYSSSYSPSCACTFCKGVELYMY
jgi:hypothetical protein